MKILYLICGILLVVQCYANNTIDIKPSPPPFWEILTLNGVDSDEDGVRDDVEIWIDETFEDPNLRMALKRLANSYKRLNDSVNNKEKFLLEKARYNLRTFCWDFVSLNLSTHPPVITLKLHEKMLNSPLRSYYFKKGFSNLDGGMMTMPDVPRHLYGVACDFTINNPRKIIEGYLSKNPHYEWGEKQQKEFKEVYETKSLIIDPYILFRMEHRGF